MLGFKAGEAACQAQSTLIGIELMHMIKKRPLVVEDGAEGLTAVNSSTLWQYNLPSDRVDAPHIGCTRKIATQPKTPI